MNKNSLFISDWLSIAYDEGRSSVTLQRLCDAILNFARST
ncbi:hypothetical protein WQQ_36790 [Hydrocarboniphaga effusa AP103]|uniref:Uncharacterized protein n=1 Tax=Hydrocarboniphaga effusa AP103 TaxID=1172194 RepID=I7Z9K3_9GAMM|nr:hypothetical protein WQQ_36790 [Hydrocarboniphaga effusa AP103]